MEKKITILYIITSTNVGGTERALLELIKRIDRTRFDILVCSLKKEGAFAEKIKQETDGFYCLELSESGGIKALLNFLPALISLFLLIRCTKPDIIHSFLAEYYYRTFFLIKQVILFDLCYGSQTS